MVKNDVSVELLDNFKLRHELFDPSVLHTVSSKSGEERKRLDKVSSAVVHIPSLQPRVDIQVHSVVDIFRPVGCLVRDLYLFEEDSYIVLHYLSVDLHRKH